MQDSKIIDVTRSFIPVDPNAYPENMHSTEKEDSPEKRFPVIPYMGYNFLPTSYGYKSFFGDNSHLEVDSLSPAEADSAFIFQTLTYRNILIALCSSGIWAKDSTSIGAWTQLVSLVEPASDSFYEWHHVTIKNKLYCFRANGAAYYKIESDAVEDIGVLLTAVVPTFITIDAQLGMSALGARLCFWDASNAVAFSSPDDLSEFTPDVKTGANVTTFNSVLGKISNIRAHGNHSIVYASKSVVLLQVQPAETFFVKAIPLIKDSGVAYAKQSVAASPDTTHYCWTDTGIYKIENGQPEVVVPEVYDHLKPYTTYPIYLRVLQGRFLFLEIMDPSALNGNAIFSTNVIPASTLMFNTTPVDEDEVTATDPGDIDACELFGTVASNYSTQSQAAADAAVPVSSRYPGSTVKKVYRCYLSMGNGPVDPITWTKTPCGGVRMDAGWYLPSPSTTAGQIGRWTTDSSNKTPQDSGDAWTDDTGWTMERFVAVQTALWKTDQDSMQDYIDKITSRVEEPTQQIVQNVLGCTASGPTTTQCTIGRYPTEFLGPVFGYNTCRFWLSRFAIEGVDIKNNYIQTISCSNTPEAVTPTYTTGTAGSPSLPAAHGSVAAAAAAYNGGAGGPYGFDASVYTAPTMTTGSNTAISVLGYVTKDGVPVGGGTQYVFAYYQAGTGKVMQQDAVGTAGVAPTGSAVYPSGYYDRTTRVASLNEAYPVVDFPPTIETAYCELVGYTYTATNGAEITVPVSTPCTDPTDKAPGGAADGAMNPPSDSGNTIPINATDGSMCGLPFPSAYMADGFNVNWPAQSVTYPAATFLLQSGSIAPRFPTLYGAFVYDLHLKKWGKMKLTYKQLLDYQPLNSASSSIINFSNFGIIAGALKADGYIYLFDDNPSDSSITWGKIGYYRAGMTDLQEIRFDFKSLCTGTLTVDTSLDGQAIGSDISYSVDFVTSRQVIGYPPYSGKWHNISLSGKFDVSYMEYKGLKKGRR